MSLTDDIQILLEKYHIKKAEWRDEVFADCVRQMILAGDFVRYTLQTRSERDGNKILLTDAEQVVYIPFREKQELQARITRLEELLKERSCCCSGCTKHNIALEENYSRFPEADGD